METRPSGVPLPSGGHGDVCPAVLPLPNPGAVKKRRRDDPKYHVMQRAKKKQEAEEKNACIHKLEQRIRVLVAENDQLRTVSFDS